MAGFYLNEGIKTMKIGFHCRLWNEHPVDEVYNSIPGYYILRDDIRSIPVITIPSDRWPIINPTIQADGSVTTFQHCQRRFNQVWRKYSAG